MTTRVIASDFHAPFHDVNAVARMLMQTAGADGITIVGDLMDTYGVSRFVRYRQIPMTQEIAAVKALLEELSSWYPDVEIVEGNHDRARLEKALRARCNDDNLMTALEVLTDGNFSIVRAVAKHLPNVRFSSHEVDGYRVRWFTQIGDVLVTHAEKFSKVPVSAVRQVEDWFVDQDAVLGLQPWRILVQAHTHQLSRTPWRADKLLMESGCLCETQGYMLDPRITGRPQRHGYITLRQKDGITDINGSREWWLDADA